MRVCEGLEGELLSGCYSGVLVTSFFIVAAICGLIAFLYYWKKNS